MTLADLQLIVQIIDLGAERGLYKGADLKTVGDLRERIIGFVKANAPQPAAEGVADESTDNKAE
jgi:hypothetical protein